ncbi:threonine/serine exporter ThrE family protein [Kitasatospora sp. NPDC059327]|uniref:threonine/serine ThrE exporter family protein n=1 Tax=Kitasatospora sp. NPDC059327 TaxID=3346803 RepID=UPI00367C5532
MSKQCHPGGQPGAGDDAPEPGALPAQRPAPWPDRMRPLVRTPMAERPVAIGAGPQERPGPAEASRVLDLALRVGESLLASGESAEDVEGAMLGVAHAYRIYPCEPQVTFTLVAISHQPTPDDPPLTAERAVRRPASDYTRLADVFRLVSAITAGELVAERACERLTALTAHRRPPYPEWLLVPASGLLAGSATLLVGGRADGRAWLVFAIAFVAALAGDRLAALVARHDLPEFYGFVIAATPAAAIGSLLSLNGLHLCGSVVITGGLFALLPGRPLVAAAQDGLTGFYLTAAARLLEVLYLMAGIVIGVMTVLYLGVSGDADLTPDARPGSTVNLPLQLAAAMLVALAFAVLLRTDRATLALVVLNSAVGWTTYAVLTDARVEPIVATGLAAGLVGLFGQLMARYRAMSALPHVTAALGPLMPGAALYFGMLAFVQGRPEAGCSWVGRACATAMALAIGVNLGGEVARLFLPASGRAFTSRRPAGRHRRRGRRRRVRRPSPRVEPAPAARRGSAGASAAGASPAGDARPTDVGFRR